MADDVIFSTKCLQSESFYIVRSITFILVINATDGKGSVSLQISLCNTYQ